MEERGRKGREGGWQHWIDHVRGLSEQCFLRCDRTRSIGISSGNQCCDKTWCQRNTSQKHKVSKQTVRIFDLFDVQR